MQTRVPHGCYVQRQCGNLLKWRRGRKCDHGTMAGYEDAMSNIFCELINFLFLPSDSRKTSDCLQFSWLPSFEPIPRCPMSEQECKINHFRVTLVAKAFCHYASSLKFCQTSGKFSHVDEVLSFLSMYVAAPRVLWLLRALQDRPLYLLLSGFN